MGCHAFLEGIFLTQGLNLCLLYLLHQQADSLPAHHLGSSRDATVSPFILLPTSHYRVWKTKVLISQPPLQLAGLIDTNMTNKIKEGAHWELLGKVFLSIERRKLGRIILSYHPGPALLSAHGRDCVRSWCLDQWQPYGDHEAPGRRIKPNTLKMVEWKGRMSLGSSIVWAIELFTKLSLHTSC